MSKADVRCFCLLGLRLFKFQSEPKMVRSKIRYIVTKIIPHKESGKFTESHIFRTIRDNVQKYYGDFGLGSVELGYRVKYVNEKTRVAIIRCRHGPHRFVTSIMPLIRKIGNYKAKFQILYTGATIMHCNKFIVKYQRDYLDRTIGKIDSAKERIDFIVNVMDF